MHSYTHGFFPYPPMLTSALSPRTGVRQVFYFQSTKLMSAFSQLRAEGLFFFRSHASRVFCRAQTPPALSCERRQFNVVQMSDMLPDVVTNLLAKSYATECLRVLPQAVSRVCDGCTEESLSQAHHTVCLSPASEKILHCKDWLPCMIDEDTVSDRFRAYLDTLRVNETSQRYGETLRDALDVSKRRRVFLTRDSFWNVVSSYCVLPSPCDDGGAKGTPVASQDARTPAENHENRVVVSSTSPL